MIYRYSEKALLRYSVGHGEVRSPRYENWEQSNRAGRLDLLSIRVGF
jgi:hypothetical protein